jgi:hypothetical protein
MWADVLVIMSVLMVATVGQWIAFDQCAPFFRAFDTETKHAWISRTTAGVVQILLVGFALIQGHSSPWGGVLLLGYMLHDIGHMLVYEKDVTSYLHHIVSVTVFGLMKLTMTPLQAESAALVMAVLESTSPVLHVTWLLKNAGYSGYSFFKYVAGFSALFFGVMRIGVFPWLMATKMDRVTAAVFSPILALSIYWFYKIVNLMKGVIEKAERAEAAASSSGQSHEP